MSQRIPRRAVRVIHAASRARAGAESRGRRCWRARRGAPPASCSRGQSGRGAETSRTPFGVAHMRPSVVGRGDRGSDAGRAPRPATGYLRDAISKLRARAPRATLPLSSGHPSTRERESLRGLPPVVREQPSGLPSDPENRLRDRERGGWARTRGNARRDGTFRDLGPVARIRPTRQPKRPRVSARASRTPRAGLEPAT